jgi:hypothetical protein
MKSDFIPASKADLDTWQVHFKAKVAAIAKELNISEAEVTETLALIDAHRAVYATMVSDRARAKAATTANGKSEKAAVTAIRELVKRIKNTKGYTEVMGNELKIVGSDAVFNKDVAKPILSVGVAANAVVIKFLKDKTDGIHLYCRRAGEKDFSFLAVDTASPYIDSRPNLVAGQTEMREYKAWHFIDDAIIGQVSDIASITI